MNCPLSEMFPSPPGPPYQGAHLYECWFPVKEGGFDCCKVRADSPEAAVAYLQTRRASCASSVRHCEIVDPETRRIAEIFKPRSAA